MIDISNILLMNYLSKLNIDINNISKTQIYLGIFCIILFNNNAYKYIKYISTYLHQLYIKNISIIEIIGWESLNDGLYTFEYPHIMTAINHYIYSNNKSNNFRYFNNKRNGLYYANDMKDTLDTDSAPNYILGSIYKLKIEDDIYISNITEDTHSNSTTISTDKQSVFNWKIKMLIYSHKHNIDYIQKFINKCIIAYDNFLSNKNNNKIYHFIYQGKKNNKLSFSSKIISDLNNPDYQNYETFDNIFHSNKDKIIADIDKLNNIEFYKKNGLKRKKGYMFYGKPGTGKTSTVMAMSNYSNRHIIEIPFSRVKTNNELELIININSIDSIDFKQDQIILLFDELDLNDNLKIGINSKNNKEQQKKNINLKSKFKSNSESDSDSDSESDSKSELVSDIIIDNKQINDKINMSTLLSRFDGIGNHAGLIIVATANNIDNIDNALYRDGRLNLIKFDNASIIDIKNIIEKYYEIVLNENDILKLNILDLKISHAKIRANLEHFDNYNELIEYLIL